MQSFTFAAGVEVLLIGVRMFIAEITLAFKGISDKLLKNAKPAVDCPVVFPFAQNAVILGFIASIVGVSVSLGKSSATTLTWGAIIIPSIVPHFFTGATAGVFGNAKGGILGCLIGGFLNGLIIQVVPWIFVGTQMIQSELAKAEIFLVWGDADLILGIFSLSDSQDSRW